MTKTKTKTTKKPRNAKNAAFTAYTDKDRVRKLTSEATILAEYRRLKLTPVWVHELLLSPALTEALQMELEDAPTEAQDAPGHPEGPQGGGDA